MTPTARERFDTGLKDVRRLLEIHEKMGGTNPGKRHGLEPLNQSAIVLLTAVWEGFVEDLAREALERLIDGIADPQGLPERLKKKVAEELKEEKHELAIWRLAGDDWKELLRCRLPDYAKQRALNLNTPDACRVQTLFARTLGLENITDAWHWQKMSRDQAQEKLDDLIKLRGDIAHGGDPKGPVHKNRVEGFIKHLCKLVEKSESCVDEYVRGATSTS